MVCNTVLYIPKEGQQCSPEGASNDKPIQRMENKPKGFCACVVCVLGGLFVLCYVGAFVSPLVSLGMLSKRSHTDFLF